MKEVELRAKVDPQIIKQALNELAAKKVSESQQKDEYFYFPQDGERELAIRIRKNDDTTLLTFKGSKQEVGWQEWETTITDADTLKELMLTSGMETLVVINKHRTQYQYKDFEINIDVIENLGTFVEAELMSDDVEAAIKRIKELFEKLGVTDIISKGYVPLMLEQ